MRYFAGFLAGLAILLSVNLAEAEDYGFEPDQEHRIPTPCEDRGFECTLVAGFGFNTGSADHGTFLGAFRISYLERIPLALEVSFVLPYGIGTNLLLYLYHGDRVNIHFIDFGIFYSWWRDMSSTWIPREFDLTVGCGLEVKVSEGLMITLDWRVFLADPFHVLPNYADFGLRAYGEATKGGELWFGVAYSF